MGATIGRIIQANAELYTELTSTDDNQDGSLTPDELSGNSKLQRFARDYYVTRLDRYGTQSLSPIDAASGTPTLIEAYAFDRNGDGSLSTYEASFARRDLQVVLAYAARMSSDITTLSEDDRRRQFGSNQMSANLTVHELSTGVVASASEAEAAVTAVQELLARVPAFAGVTLLADDATVMPIAPSRGSSSAASAFADYQSALFANGVPVSLLTSDRIVDYLTRSQDSEGTPRAVRVPFNDANGAPAGSFFVVRQGESYTIIGLPVSPAVPS